MRGRKPLPENVQKHLSPCSCPDRPIWLEGDAADCWDRLAPELASRGLLDVTMADTFGAYCVTLATMLEAIRLMKSRGLIAPSKGMERIHPAAIYFTHLAQQLRAYAADFGITPVARLRLGGSRDQETDELEDFVASA